MDPFGTPEMAAKICADYYDRYNLLDCERERNRALMMQIAYASAERRWALEEVEYATVHPSLWQTVKNVPVGVWLCFLVAALAFLSPLVCK